jgi:hypothetical protein
LFLLISVSVTHFPTFGVIFPIQLKVDAKVVRQWKANHILEAGLAISETREATMQVLEREVLAEFKRRVNKDPNASSSQKATMLLAQHQKEITGGRVWKRFKEIKKIQLTTVDGTG